MLTRQIQNPSDTPARFQRTDDRYLDATKLLAEYNSKVMAKDSKDMRLYKSNKSTKEYAAFIEQKYGVKKAYISSKAGTWMHPHLFIDFAMWISLEFKDMAIKWILDGLIEERNNAGDHANLLKSTIIDRYIEYNGCKPNPMIYQNEFLMLKELAGVEDRNTATEKQLKTLNALQVLDIQLIKDKVGKTSRYKQLKQLAEAWNAVIK